MKIMKISIIGSGFVGRGLGQGFETLGNDVIFYDINQGVLNSLKKDHQTSLDLTYVIKNTSISFVCVPTPYNNGFDSTYIKSSLRAIGEVLKAKNDFHLIVIKSTILLTMTRKLLIPILNENTIVGEKVGVCMNPEFMTQSSSSWTDNKNFEKVFMNEDRIVIGEYDKRSGDILEKLYAPLNKPIFRVSLDMAEMLKYASNCMLATKISFWNEIFLICNELGIESNELAGISALDPRIGIYGTVHGKAFGGECLEKDLQSFIEFSDKIGEFKLLKSVNEVNKKMKKEYGQRN